MDSFVFTLAAIFIIIMIIPTWLWCTIICIIFCIIFVSAIIWAFNGSHASSDNYASSGNYGGGYSGGDTTESKESRKEERGKWSFNEEVVIEGGKVSDKGAFGSGILSRELGHVEKRGGAFEYDHIRISKGTFGNEKVAEIRGDKVYDSHGNQVAEVKQGFFGKTIVDKNGKKLGEIKD